jgi:hypothetical protein
VLQIVETMQIEHRNDMLNLQQLWQKRFEESAAQKEWFMEIFTNNFASSLRDGIVNDMNSQLKILECYQEAAVSKTIKMFVIYIYCKVIC